MVCVLDWQPNQQNNSKLRNTLLQFVYVLVTLLETAQSVASSVIFYQLLKSGDVEQNPGPGIFIILHDYCGVTII